MISYSLAELRDGTGFVPGARFVMLSNLSVALDLEKEVRNALEGDSNDAEHDALASVAEALHITYEVEP